MNKPYRLSIKSATTALISLPPIPHSETLMTLTKSTVCRCSPFGPRPCGPAFADTVPGWYIGLGAGASFAEESQGHTAAGDRTVTYNVPGFSVNGNGGYAWDNGIRAEGEIFYNNNTVDKVGAANGTGHLSKSRISSSMVCMISRPERCGRLISVAV